MTPFALSYDMAHAGLAELERKLRELSHSDQAIQEVQRFSGSLAGTKERLATWNAARAIVRRPIESGQTAALGFNAADDAFTLLQGDVVRTESAYFLGERVTGRPKYAVLNSTCDLVPGAVLTQPFCGYWNCETMRSGPRRSLGRCLSLRAETPCTCLFYPMMTMM